MDADQGKLTSVNRQSSILREQTLRKEIEKITTVTARGEAGCSEDISFGQCNSAALADAKRKAAEQATSKGMVAIIFLARMALVIDCPILGGLKPPALAGSF